MKTVYKVALLATTVLAISGCSSSGMDDQMRKTIEKVSIESAADESIDTAGIRCVAESEAAIASELESVENEDNVASTSCTVLDQDDNYYAQICVVQFPDGLLGECSTMTGDDVKDLLPHLTTREAYDSSEWQVYSD